MKKKMKIVNIKRFVEFWFFTVGIIFLVCLTIHFYMFTEEYFTIPIYEIEDNISDPSAVQVDESYVNN